MIEYDLEYKERTERGWNFWDSYETFDKAKEALEAEVKKDNEKYEKGLFLYRIMKKEEIYNSAE